MRSHWIAGICRFGLPFGLALMSASAELTNRWSFNDAAGSAPDETTMVDSISGAVATVQGNGSTFSGTALTLTGTTTGNRSAGFISGYVDLPNGIISSKTNLSLEIWATPLSAKNYQRLFDFGRVNTAGFGGGAQGEIIDVPGNGQTPGNTSGSDNLYLSFCIGTDLNGQRMEALLDGTSVVSVDTAEATIAATQYHYVMTFEDGVGAYGSSGGRMTWYRNGTMIGTGDVSFHLSALEDVNNWLGRSQWTADSNANAAYNEVRLYNHVLSSEEISANLAVGPDTLGTVLEPAPIPDHLWIFNNDADSTVDSGAAFTDSIGGMVGTLRGNGAALTGTALRLPGTTTGNQPAESISAYLDLPNGLISAQSGITVEAWAAPLSSKNWQRLFDFGRCATTHGTGAAVGEILDGAAAPGATTGYDNLSLTLNNAGNLNSQQLEGQYDGNAAQYSSTTAATTPGTQYHYVLVAEDGAGIYGESGCQVRWYRDGVLQNSMDFPFLLTNMENVNNWIGRSMYSGDSNSNLSLNELRIYRRAITPGEVLSSYAAGPDPGAGEPEPLPPAPVPESRWSFNNPAAAVGTAFTDTVSGETATVRGNGATLSGTALVLPGTTNGNQTAAAISAYLDLRNGIVSSHPSLTFEAWATPVSSKNWQRLFDFGNSSLTSGAGASTGEIIDGATAPGAFVASDNLMLSLNKNGVLGSHRIEALMDSGSAATLDTDLSGSTIAGVEHHYVLTVQDGAGAYGSTGSQAKWYRDGEIQGMINLSYRLSDLQDVNNWIGRSQWAADVNSNIALNELRFYDRALTAGEVISSFTAGANAIFPPPTTLPDTATIQAGQKVRIAVLDNDTGGVNAATLTIVNAPSVGTASVQSNGEILYAHSGASLDPVTFTYQVSGQGGQSAATLVTVQITEALRIPNDNFNVPANQPPTEIQVVPAFPGVTFNDALCFASPPGDSQRLFVCEIGGLLKVIPDVTAATATSAVVLDLPSVIASPARTPAETIQGGANGECGLLGMAFHPDFANNGYFYVFYSIVKSGTSGFFQRVSRFTVPPAQISASAPVADPASELILIEQYDQGPNHQGGDMHFGGDGYLYISIGDEENPNDTRLNSQRIDKDFFAGMLRIDVDKLPGNLEPNDHASVPKDGGIARYSVPADNPFVGATSFNNLTINPAQVRTEFYAVGLRSPWRFSIDDATGEIWCGDVGQDRYEELDLIEKGGNYGWVFREGAHDINVTNAGWPAKPNPFVSIDPIYEYVHNSMTGETNFKGNSIIGGVVYHGDRVPSLTGAYVFGDQVSGHIWALTRAGGLPGGAVTVQRIGGQSFLSNFGTDPSNGDVLVSDYFGGRIMRIVSATPTNGYPATLSETGLFADLTDLSPAPGLLPYEPNLTFWSDHAVKRRWFTLPDLNSHMTWSREGNWTFPAGEIWVKHFDMETVRGNPATKKRIETRILVRNENGGYGVSYRWNEVGTEATLVEDGGVDFPIGITIDGVETQQPWRIPSRAQCMNCHTPLAGHALSFNTRQLNKTFTIQNITGNQIDLLAAAGYLGNTPDPSSGLAFHLRPDEAAYPLEARVRSYLAVNCSYCHQPGGSGTSWDGRPELTLEQTGMVSGNSTTALNPGDKLIVPGDPDHSVILSRISATHGYTRMPPLGSNVVDQSGIDLLTAWIGSELPNRPLYDQWRATFFAALDPAGDKTADADGDGMSNYTEYLLGSSPLSGSGSWQAQIANDADGLSLGFLRKAHRIYSIETSADLNTWELWNVPENHAGYNASDAWTTIPFTSPPGGKSFFRFHVAEP